jgi:hypothetical protein
MGILVECMYYLYPLQTVAGGQAEGSAQHAIARVMQSLLHAVHHVRRCVRMVRKRVSLIAKAQERS